jgi:Cys-tRNA(Pro)/Cys-tRNA(Cys) deacylase
MAKKTLSMRVLDGANVPYDVIEFPEIIHDATEVATYADETPDHVYKTLVAVRNQGKPMLVMVASNRKLNLKQFAAAIGEKKVNMAKHAEAERLTGLQVGGISALALLNKRIDVYIDRPALDLPHILVSAGKRGINLRLPVERLIEMTGAKVIEATDEPEA